MLRDGKFSIQLSRNLKNYFLNFALACLGDRNRGQLVR